MSRVRMALHKVFLYGTLKQGEHNNSLLTTSANGVARYLCKGVTPERYPLVIGTRYNIPFLLNQPGRGPYILGEVWEVDDQMLQKLDELEGVKGGYYDREKLTFNLFEYGRAVDCFMYVLNSFPPSMLTLPTIDDYKNTSSKPYVPPANRKDGPSKELLWIDHQ